MKKQDTYYGQKVAFFSPDEGYVLGTIISLEDVEDSLQEQLQEIDMTERVIIKTENTSEVLVKGCKNLIGALQNDCI